ncbi:MAG: hypothetical protein ACK53L_03075, partial [Pirellulaceae bacterium]
DNSSEAYSLPRERFANRRWTQAIRFDEEARNRTALRRTACQEADIGGRTAWEEPAGWLSGKNARRARVGAGNRFDVFRESDESTAASAALHVRKAPGQGSGDYTEIVAEQLGGSIRWGADVVFPQGRRGRKVEAESNPPSHTRKVYYLIDLRPSRHRLAEGAVRFGGDYLDGVRLA